MQNNDKRYNSESWYSGVLNGIATGLNKFVKIFKRNGLLYTTIVMILFITFYSLVINPVRIDKIVETQFERYYQAQKDKETISLQRRNNADEIVGDIMTKLIDKCPNIHRTLLLEGHNSLQSHSGIDFNYYSCTMEMLSQNNKQFIYLSEDLQRQMRTNLIGLNMYNTLKHRSYIYFNNLHESQYPNNRLIVKLSGAGDSEAIVIPFINESNEPIVLLVISGEQLPVNDIIEYVNDFTKEIQRYLM